MHGFEFESDVDTTTSCGDTAANCAVVAIPRNEYKALIVRNAMLNIILRSKDEDAWRLARIVELVYKTINGDTAPESGGDDNA